MELAKRQIGDRLEVAVKGRLDAYWAEHLARLLAEAIGGGTRHLRLDLGEVDYLSSAGIRVLLQYYKQLKGGRGSFLVSATSAPVKTVLALVGLEELLGGKGEPSPSRPGGAGESDEQSRVTLLDRGAARFEVFAGSPFASLSCRAIGDPGLLSGGLCARRTQSLTMQFPQGAFAVGLGALGYDFQDCRDRFGEFLAVAGALVYRPMGMRPVPDYQLQAGAFLPQAQVLSCLACEGQFAYLVRFEAKPAIGAVPFSELVSTCLDIARADAVGMVMVAESAALVGSVLTRSPAIEVPDRTGWAQSEGAQVRGVALVVGVAAREDRPALEPVLHPLGDRSWPTGYFHAAAFSHRPLKGGEIDLATTVAALFETESPQRVLRLGRDDQAGVARRGPEQSEWVRGACWFGPIAEATAEPFGA